jgi:agmatine deiminase
MKYKSAIFYFSKIAKKCYHPIMIKRLPAEWEPQDSILMVFPHEKTDWIDDMQRAQSVFLRMASSISATQKLILICDDIEKTKQFFCYHDRISFVKLETNDTWIRDFGPITIYHNQQRELIDFQFNGWGNKYEASLDNMITKSLHAKWHFMLSPLQHSDFVLEGGSIESDGQGTLMSTKKCLLNPNRNPKLSQKEIENTLGALLGVTHFLWLEHGELEGDDTDAHIDTLARFVDTQTIVYVSCENKRDSHYMQLKKMEDELKAFRTQKGDSYRLVPLPLPNAIYKDKQRLAATYANFLITNKSILLPVYNDTHDKEMVDLFKSLFPTREIIPINALRLIEEGGSIHCSTMQVAK